ncbi:M23 family metallopeptidase [Actinomadura sp. ATCC 31491]|uniref:M23 family metallopeptidase n=1 Tax=Actinomadura luzonensis TaxID=2805427 RepID=A0ABT0GBS0_9ACTN|nr:peptidoglycan DD-metalloendopeptidase family protein [Actinomadura luzonensis]MCK2221521.1 M23 family metallopeptidase [Actinomadura luzonensis]
MHPHPTSPAYTPSQVTPNPSSHDPAQDPAHHPSGDTLRYSPHDTFRRSLRGTSHRASRGTYALTLRPFTALFPLLLTTAFLALPASPARASPPDWRWPLTGHPRILRRFTPPPERWLAGHRGIDLAAPPFTPVLAAGAGTIRFAGQVGGRGVVTIAHTDGLRTTYMPLTPSVKRGQTITPGTELGLLQPTKPHCQESCLHWGLLRGARYLNPLLLLGQAPIRLLPLWPTPDQAPWPTPHDALRPTTPLNQIPWLPANKPLWPEPTPDHVPWRPQNQPLHPALRQNPQPTPNHLLRLTPNQPIVQAAPATPLPDASDITVPSSPTLPPTPNRRSSFQHRPLAPFPRSYSLSKSTALADKTTMALPIALLIASCFLLTALRRHRNHSNRRQRRSRTPQNPSPRAQGGRHRKRRQEAHKSEGNRRHRKGRSTPSF